MKYKRTLKLTNPSDSALKGAPARIELPQEVDVREVRIWLDGIEVERWADQFSQAIWVNVDLPPRGEINGELRY